MPSRPRYPRGSEWRRWDLHVHTPYSALNNGFGSDFAAYARYLFQAALAEQVAVIGVTDYFTIAGYRALRNLQEQPPPELEALLGPQGVAAASAIRLLPNIELRSSIVIPAGQGQGNRVNFHVLFSSDVDPNDIDEHFLREVKFTAESGPGALDEKWSLTLVNLENLGRRLKEVHQPFRDHSDLFVGMMNAVVSHEEVTDVLERQASRFKNRFLLITSSDEDLSQCSWNGQAHLARKLFIQKSHMLFSANSGTREFGLGKRHPSLADYLKEFKSLKPCVNGSDAHDFATLFNPANGKKLWIRADPTFLGLTQLLNEPESRVFMGDEPASLVRVSEKATKYMDGVSFQQTSQAKSGQDWFAGQVPLNPGLVAVIGNKGSGKSALADILALLGESTASKHFSFLNAGRFLTPKTRLGEMFEATVQWRSGEPRTKLLSDGCDPTRPELVKYIPQNYLETICSDLKDFKKSDFDLELQEVIFSHVDKASRHGRNSLSELIDYRTEEKGNRIELLVRDLSKVNAELSRLERELSAEFRSGLEQQLEQRRAELLAHDEARPPEVLEPQKDEQQQERIKGVQEELEGLVNEAERLDAEIVAIEGRVEVASSRSAAASRLLDRIDNLERSIGTFHRESVSDCQILGIASEALLRFEVNRSSVVELREAAEASAAEARASLSQDAEDSVMANRRRLSEKMTEVRSRLDEPNRLYQQYLHEIAKWKKRRADVEGNAERPDTVKGLEARLNGLAGLPETVDRLRTNRLQIAVEIFGVKSELLEDYRRLYEPVQEFINRHPVSQQQGALEFSAAIVPERFSERFLEFIHLGKKGSFQGESEAHQLVSEILAEADFTETDGLRSFLDAIQWRIEHDTRGGGSDALPVGDQLRQNRRTEDLYDFLYGLDYLRPRFSLRWQGKPLDQLSPGERGTLLLVFYLLIDKRDIPLIIDQPEENLDNQTVATLLVPAIKFAKERRQVIIVTHNPNLAVVCDADQVIHSEMKKTAAATRITYTSGAIEEPLIAQRVVDVLEGTKPAFDLRDAKYEILETR